MILLILESIIPVFSLMAVLTFSLGLAVNLVDWVTAGHSRGERIE